VAKAVTGDGAQEMTAEQYRLGLNTLRGYLEKRGEDSASAERFITDMTNALPGAAGTRVPVSRDVFAAFLRYEAAWARKTRDGKNPNVTDIQRAQESARAEQLKLLFRKEARLNSPRFYSIFQASVKDVRRAPRRVGKDFAGNSAVFFGDQIDDSYTHVDAGDVALENGNTDGAINEADRALQENPENADAFVLRAGAEYDRQDLPAAIRDARSALALDPGNQQARAIVSLSGADAGRAALTSAAAGSAGLADDGRSAALPQLGLAGADQPAGLPGTSASAAPPSAGFAAASLAPSSALTRDAFGTAGSAAGRAGPPSATPAVGAILSRDITERAVGLSRSDARSSIDQLDQALTLNPRNASARSWRSAILNRIGDYSSALASAKESLTGNPDDAGAYYNKAYALAGQGDKPGVLDALTQAARLDPGYQPVLDQALMLPRPEDLAMLFSGSAASHLPALPPARRRPLPLALVIPCAFGGVLSLAALALLLRKQRPKTTPFLCLLVFLSFAAFAARAGDDDEPPAAAQPDEPPADKAPADEKTPADDRTPSTGKAETPAGGIGLSGGAPQPGPAGVQTGRENEKAPAAQAAPAQEAASSGGGSSASAPPAAPPCQSYVCRPPPVYKTDPKEPCMPAKDRPSLVACVHARVNPQDERGAFEVTRRVAWALRGECAGLLLKPAGSNIVAWRGASFSASRIAYPNGHLFKILSDVGAGGHNAPAWEDEECVESKRYVPAINPTLP
jgi:tetratricopeptide (TPR) repeat protein